MKKRWEVQKLNNLLGPTPGTIWRTKPDPSTDKFQGPMVLIRTRSERPDVTVLSVVEVSKDVLNFLDPDDDLTGSIFLDAVDEDLILERQLTELPFRCMVRTGNLFPTTPDDLLTCIGELDDGLMHIISRMASFRTSMEEAIGLGRGTLTVEPVTLVPLINYAGFVRTGLPASEDDPRLARLREACSQRKYLSREAKRHIQW